MPPRLGFPSSSSETASSSISISPNGPSHPSSSTRTSPTTIMTNPAGSNNGTNSSSNRNLELKLYRQQSSFRFTECQEWLKQAWGVHFILCSIAIIVGSLASSLGGRAQKYVPIDVDNLNGEAQEQQQKDCTRGFVNVFAESINEPGALYCCTSDSKHNPEICESAPWFLFFAGRLSRFPDAWLLPLFPLFFRGFIILTRRILRRKGISSSSSSRGSSYGGNSSSPSSKSDLMYTKRRFLLYIGLIQIRGWILYLLFDEIEDAIVSFLYGTESHLASSCWYEDLLHSNHHNMKCHGRESDFSDHVVLYYAQILPIALTEVLHSFVVPYWENHKDAVFAGRKKHASLIPIVLILFMTNLYMITFLGVYKTSVYFHTIPEVIMGFIVSLCIQIPLFMLQCTTSFPSILRARDWLYGYSIS